MTVSFSYSISEILSKQICISFPVFHFGIFIDITVGISDVMICNSFIQPLLCHSPIGIIYHIIIWFILALIVYHLCADLFWVIRKCSIYDLRTSLYYDFTEKSARYGKDFMYIEKPWWFNNGELWSSEWLYLSQTMYNKNGKRAMG